MKTLIAIPTYNEFGNIDNLINSILIEVDNADILFIDDNSTDGTLELINVHKKKMKILN